VDAAFASGATWLTLELVVLDDADAAAGWGAPAALISFGLNETNSSRMARGTA
jgi:hypothetical protein